MYAKTDLEQNGKHVSFFRWREALDMSTFCADIKRVDIQFLKRSHKYIRL
jgi:hypothetical protein